MLTMQQNGDNVKFDIYDPTAYNATYRMAGAGDVVHRGLFGRLHDVSGSNEPFTDLASANDHAQFRMMVRLGGDVTMQSLRAKIIQPTHWRHEKVNRWIAYDLGDAPSFKVIQVQPSRDSVVEEAYVVLEMQGTEN